MSGKKTLDSSSQVSRNIVVTNRLGIHARPASMFVRLANQFKCDIFVEKDGETVNVKSIMGLMTLAAGPGSQIRVEARGDDANRAVDEIESLLDRKFGED